jgi:hypothetical protein
MVAAQPFIVKDLSTGKKHEWSLAQVLHEINRDTSEGWDLYNTSDWAEGWECWAEGDCFTMLQRGTL